MKLSGATLPEAIRCASLNPACVIGMENQFGSICVGKTADLVLLDRQLTPVMTLVEGRIAYDARTPASVHDVSHSVSTVCAA